MHWPYFYKGKQMPPDYKSVIKMNGEAHDEVSLDNKKNVLAYSITNHNPHELSDSSSTVSNEPFTFISRIKPTFPLGAPEFLDTSIDNH